MGKKETDGFNLYGKAEVLAMVSTRVGETRLGERVQTVNSLVELKDSSARFVILGLPEDIGVRANSGIAGAATAWEPALKTILNIQSNSFLEGSEILVLGHFSFTDPEATTPIKDTGSVEKAISPSETDHSLAANLKRLQGAVAQIDEQVYPVILSIVAAGKIPIVIGGGHNNAYPLLKGLSMALNKSVSVVNIDAHADLRPVNGRHSGNGFSYAIANGFLRHYGIFGLHKNYNNTAILTAIAESTNIHAVFFDDLLKNDSEGNPQNIPASFRQLLDILPPETGPDIETGLEIDLDCIENVLSSAFTPSGFTLNEVRRIIINSKKKFAYMHICEGATRMADGREGVATAKTIAYLVTDFIRAQS